jgi:cAMP-dependent protein kinase regulator
MNFQIPEGLTDLLQDFTVEVLRKRPADLVGFAAQYFEELLDKRAGENTSNILNKLAQVNKSNNHNHSENEEEEEEDDEIGDMPDLPKNKYTADNIRSLQNFNRLFF